jgi:gag-polypeptide of LTR copia-type
MSVILSSTPERIQMKVFSTKTSKQMWDMICAEHESRWKMSIFRVEVCRRLYNSRCDESGDVLEHLGTITTMREELALAGGSITDDEFVPILVDSLPSSYKAVICPSYNIARSVGIPVSANGIVSVVEREYSRRRIASGTLPTQTNVLSTQTAGTADEERKEKKKDKRRCVNPKCRRFGHKIEDCWREGGGKEGQGPRQQGRNRGEGPDNYANTAVQDDASSFAYAITPAVDGYALSAKGNRQFEIFDSGASQHISPYRKSFTNFEKTEVKQICAADNHVFEAVGKGEMTIEVPNSGGTSKITLRNVLYAPSIGYTLVSLSQLDKEGYSTLIQDGTLCIIDRRTEATVGKILVEKSGIWQTAQQTTLWKI